MGRAARSPERVGYHQRVESALSPVRSVGKRATVAPRSPRRNDELDSRAPLSSGEKPAPETRHAPSTPAGPLRVATKLVGEGWLGTTSEQNAEVDQMIRKLHRVRSRSEQAGVRVQISPERTRPARAHSGPLGRRTVHDIYGEHAATNDELQTQVAAVSLELAKESNARVTDFSHHAATLRKQSSAPMPSETTDALVGHWIGSVPSAGGVWLPSPDGEGLGAKRFASVLEKIARRQEMQRQRLIETAGEASPGSSRTNTRATSSEPTSVRIVPILSGNLASQAASLWAHTTNVAMEDSDATDDEADFETDTEYDSHPAARHTELPTLETEVNVPELSTALRSVVDEPSQQKTTAVPNHRHKKPPPPKTTESKIKTSSAPIEASRTTNDGAELPAGWSLQWSASHRRTYYWNEHTQTSSWERPTAEAVASDQGSGSMANTADGAGAGAAANAAGEEEVDAADAAKNETANEVQQVEALRKKSSVLTTKRELHKVARQVEIDENESNKVMDADGGGTAGVDFKFHQQPEAAQASQQTPQTTPEPRSNAKLQLKRKGASAAGQRSGCCAARPTK